MLRLLALASLVLDAIASIPTLSSTCDTLIPTDECIKAWNYFPGAYLYWDKDHGCTLEQKTDIETGYENSQDMLDGVKNWSGEKTRDTQALEYYFGNDWRGFGDRFRGNIDRAANFTLDSSWRWYYITMSCRDPHDICSRYNNNQKQAGGFAWTVPSTWTWWTYGHITFCDPYYTLNDTNGKKEYLNYGLQRDPDFLKDMRNYQTFGQFFTHELMHLQSTWEGEPRIIDEILEVGSQGSIKAYGPALVRRLATQDSSGGSGQRGAAVSSTNADSYTMFINAVYWWESMGEFPIAPNRPPRSDTPQIIMPFLELNEADISDASLGPQLDEAFTSYFADDDSWTPSYTPLKNDVNACHGVGGDYWIENRGLAYENIVDFCFQSNRLVVYNAGTVDELWLSVTCFNNNSAGPVDSPDCYNRFKSNVIDGCDGNDPLNNPHNHKFGSNFFTADGWEYAMKPLNQKVNEVICDVRYQEGYKDRFEIRGKNLPDAHFRDGEELHDRLAECDNGGLTNWLFEFTPSDCCFEWHASGEVAFGNKQCVGDALISAGASSMGNCHGPY